MFIILYYLHRLTDNAFYQSVYVSVQAVTFESFEPGVDLFSTIQYNFVILTEMNQTVTFKEKVTV